MDISMRNRSCNAFLHVSINFNFAKYYSALEGKRAEIITLTLQELLLLQILQMKRLFTPLTGHTRVMMISQQPQRSLLILYRTEQWIWDILTLLHDHPYEKLHLMERVSSKHNVIVSEY